MNTNPLGRLEDLPGEYLAQMRELNLVPLWPNLRDVLPPNKPRPSTHATLWPYRSARPLLMQAGELTPIEKAERRVLVLANPGHGLENMRATSAIYLGLQLLLPGESAPSHRHTPNAVRLVVEGEGAYSVVDGQRCPMLRGDLILTPTGVWHEHGHEGEHPVIWLDVLDLPLVHYLEASYAVEGRRQQIRPDAQKTHLRSGMVPTPMFERRGDRYPMLRYAWSDTRAALIGLAENQPTLDHVQITYINPETGDDAENVLGFHALMLRPGQTLNLPVRSPACVFHVIDGSVKAVVDGEEIAMSESDTACVPGFAYITLHNQRGGAPSFVFVADESPLHKKLGLYEVSSA
jgi:gentisate 1,2-dioxygenase